MTSTRNFVTGVFIAKAEAYAALHALWQLDRAGDITLHGTAVVHRDEQGRFRVDTKETHPAMATAVGVGIGALLGALAGPVGMTIGIAAGATLGAAAGAAVGVTADIVRADTREQAECEAAAVILHGQSAMIADVSEHVTDRIDAAVMTLGGVLYRRRKSSVRYASWFDDGYLYPYEHVPAPESIWSR